jgi:hypothetical protein
MSDTLYDGRRFRTLNVLDEGNREGLAIEVGTSLPGSRVVALLDQLVAIHGAPRAIRCDNGPELISEALRDWAERRGVALHFIQPGKPNQNAYIERFNRTYRREVLDACLFASLADVRAETAAWLTTYNTERPARQPGRPAAAHLPAQAHHPRPVQLRTVRLTGELTAGMSKTGKVTATGVTLGRPGREIAGAGLASGASRAQRLLDRVRSGRVSDRTVTQTFPHCPWLHAAPPSISGFATSRGGPSGTPRWKRSPSWATTARPWPRSLGAPASRRP